MGCSDPWEQCGRSKHRDQAMAWISVVVESQERESSPEDYLAQRWVEERSHSLKPKQRELRTKKLMNS